MFVFSFDKQVEDQLPAVTTASELQIPGLAVYPEFVSTKEEQVRTSGNFSNRYENIWKEGFCINRKVEF
jgi:hypothetical protein